MSAARPLRVGCDVVALTEVAEALGHFGDRYRRRVYTATERADAAGAGEVASLAARFAAKEATVKAFADPDAAFGIHDVEVVLEGPLPRLRLAGAAADLARRQGWTDVEVSLSHTDCHAAAVVVALCDPGPTTRRDTEEHRR